MHKQVREIIDKAELLGFRVDHIDGNNHYALVCDRTGEWVRVACTPSEYRATANVLADMERKSGRKLPRQRTGRASHKSMPRTVFVKSSAERSISERMDRIEAQAEQLRVRFMECAAGDRSRCDAKRARKCLDEFTSLRRVLEKHGRRIEPIEVPT